MLDILYALMGLINVPKKKLITARYSDVFMLKIRRIQIAWKQWIDRSEEKVLYVHMENEILKMRLNFHSLSG